MLCGLGLQFARSLEVGHVGEMHIDSLLAQFPFHLADSLHEGRAFDVADCTAYLSDYKVIVVALAKHLDVSLDFVGDVRHHLDSLAQIVATTLFVYYTFIYTSCGH